MGIRALMKLGVSSMDKAYINYFHISKSKLTLDSNLGHDLTYEVKPETALIEAISEFFSQIAKRHTHKLFRADIQQIVLFSPDLVAISQLQFEQVEKSINKKTMSSLIEFRTKSEIGTEFPNQKIAFEQMGKNQFNVSYINGEIVDALDVVQHKYGFKFSRYVELDRFIAESLHSPHAQVRALLIHHEGCFCYRIIDVKNNWPRYVRKWSGKISKVQIHDLLQWERKLKIPHPTHLMLMGDEVDLSYEEFQADWENVSLKSHNIKFFLTAKNSKNLKRKTNIS